MLGNHRYKMVRLLSTIGLLSVSGAMALRSTSPSSSSLGGEISETAVRPVETTKTDLLAVDKNIINAKVAGETRDVYQHVSAGFGKSTLDITVAEGANSVSRMGVQVYFVQPKDINPPSDQPPPETTPHALVDYLRSNSMPFTGEKLGSVFPLCDPTQDKKSCTVIGVGENEIPIKVSDPENASAPHTTPESVENVKKTYLLVGLGDGSKAIRYSQFEKVMKALSDTIVDYKFKEVVLHVYPNKEVSYFSSPRELAKGLKYASYKLDILKSKKNSHSGNSVDVPALISILPSNPEEKEAAAQLVQEGVSTAIGQNYARILKDLPANICSTDYMRKEMENLQKNSKGFSDYTCVTEKEMANLAMGCFTGVGVGSSMPSYLTKIEYNKALKDSNPDGVPTVVLLGKGVVHDSGGLCIKTAGPMCGMKMDMGGSATVMGALKAVSEMGLPIHVVGALGLVENSVSSKAYRPGDVLQSMNGITVEVGNTDAEGRLVLADALTWLEKQYATPTNKPTVIDIATLTGACAVGLGNDLSGGFSNSPSLLDELEQAGHRSGDRLWKMPLLEVETEYLEHMKSDVADINNVGGAQGGAVKAAIFLNQFCKNLNWAHIDCAAVAMGGSFDKPKATGRPVALLTEFLKKRSEDAK